MGKSLLKEEKEKCKDKDKVKKEKTPKKGKIVLENSDLKVTDKVEVSKENTSKDNQSKKKENPLSKFFVKSGAEKGSKKDCVKENSTILNEKVIESEETLVEVGTKQVVEDDDIQIVEKVTSEKPTTSTPLRTSPRKKVSNTKQVVED